MKHDDTTQGDGRRQRTRQAITDALIRLMSDQRYSAIRTTDLIQAAGVGRSTFYEHFQSREAVLETIVEPILTPLGLAGAGLGNTARLKVLLDHLWDRRAPGRHLFAQPLQLRLKRSLAVMIEGRLEAGDGHAIPSALKAGGAAAAQLTMLQMWLPGEAQCTPEALAMALVGARGQISRVPTL